MRRLLLLLLSVVLCRAQTVSNSTAFPSKDACCTSCWWGDDLDDCLQYVGNIATWYTPNPWKAQDSGYAREYFDADDKNDVHAVGDIIEMCFTRENGLRFYQWQVLKPYASKASLSPMKYSQNCRFGDLQDYSDQWPYQGKIAGPISNSSHMPTWDDACSCGEGGTSALADSVKYKIFSTDAAQSQASTDPMIPFTDPTLSPEVTTTVYNMPTVGLTLSRPDGGGSAPRLSFKIYRSDVEITIPYVPGQGENIPGKSQVPKLGTISYYAVKDTYKNNRPYWGTPYVYWAQYGKWQGAGNVNLANMQWFKWVCAGVEKLSIVTPWQKAFQWTDCSDENYCSFRDVCDTCDDEDKWFGPSRQCLWPYRWQQSNWKTNSANGDRFGRQMIPACAGYCTPTFYWTQTRPIWGAVDYGNNGAGAISRKDAMANTKTAQQCGFGAPPVAETYAWCDAPSLRTQPTSMGEKGYGPCPTDVNGVVCGGASRGKCMTNGYCFCNSNLFGGRACDIDVPTGNYACAQFNPCSETGECADVAGVATCTCHRGWRGSITDIRIRKLYARHTIGCDGTCLDPLTDSRVIDYQKHHQCLFWWSRDPGEADRYLGPLTVEYSNHVRPIWFKGPTDILLANHHVNQIAQVKRGYNCRDARPLVSNTLQRSPHRAGDSDESKAVLYGGPGCLPCPDCALGRGDCVSTNSTLDTPDRMCKCRPNFDHKRRVRAKYPSCIYPGCATGPLNCSQLGLECYAGQFQSCQVTFCIYAPCGFTTTTPGHPFVYYVYDFGFGLPANYTKPNVTSGSAPHCENYCLWELNGICYQSGYYERNGPISVPTEPITYPTTYGPSSPDTCSMQLCPIDSTLNDTLGCGYPYRGYCDVFTATPAGAGYIGKCICYDGWTNSGTKLACNVPACPKSQGRDGRMRVCGGTFASDASPANFSDGTRGDNACNPASTQTTCKNNSALQCDESKTGIGGYSGSCICTTEWVNNQQDGACSVQACPKTVDGKECNNLVVHGTTTTNVCDRAPGNPKCQCWKARNPNNPGQQTGVSYYGKACEVQYEKPGACVDPFSSQYCAPPYAVKCTTDESTDFPEQAPTCRCEPPYTGQWCEQTDCSPPVNNITIIRRHASCTAANTNDGIKLATGTCETVCMDNTGGEQEHLFCYITKGTPVTSACDCFVVDTANNNARCRKAGSGEGNSAYSATCSWFDDSANGCTINKLNCTYWKNAIEGYNLCNGVPGACNKVNDTRKWACTQCTAAYSGTRCQTSVACGGTCNTTGGVCAADGSGGYTCQCKGLFTGPNCDQLACDGIYNYTSGACGCGTNGVYIMEAGARKCMKGCPSNNGVECGSKPAIGGSRCNGTTKYIKGSTIGSYVSIYASTPVVCDCDPATPTAVDPLRPDRSLVPWIINSLGYCEPYCKYGALWTGSACDCANTLVRPSPYTGARCDTVMCHNGGNYITATQTCNCTRVIANVSFPWDAATNCLTSVCAPNGVYIKGSAWCNCSAPFQASRDPFEPLCEDPCKPNGVGNLTAKACTCKSGWSGEFCEIQKPAWVGAIATPDGEALVCTSPKIWDADAGFCRYPTCINGVYNVTGDCVCVFPWEGLGCNVDSCELHNGEAVIQSGKWNCTCNAGYYKLDKHCDYTYCFPGTPQASGSSYVCICGLAYVASAGKCIPADCGNGVTNIDAVTGLTKCACKAGWNSTTPGGVCSVNICGVNLKRWYDVTTSACTCVFPYTGDNCETYECGFGGASVQRLQVGTVDSAEAYGCVCKTGFIVSASNGRCVASCDVVGTQDAGDSGCRCKYGYTGSQCQISVQTQSVEEESTPLVKEPWFIGTVVAASVATATGIGVGTFFLVRFLKP